MNSRSRGSLLSIVAALALATAPPRVSAQEVPKTLELDLGGGVTLDLVLVKAGAFRQGSPSTEAGRGDDETPREVTLTRDFYIGRFEVTKAQFERFVAATGYKTEAEKGTSGGFGWTGQALEQRPSFNWRNPGFPNTEGHPVTIVTYDDALAFTRWLSGAAKRTVTLPTEAQWEFAARGSTSFAYPSSDAKADPAALGWSKANAGAGTHAVGEKAPNAIGLHDMAGNVAEWCLDWYGPYAAGPITDPMETRSNLGDKPRRVLRGGSWLRDPKNGRSAARYRSTPGSRNADNGFRIVASVGGAPLSVPVAASAKGPAAGSRAEGESTGAFGALVKLVGAVLALFIGTSLVARLFKRSPGGVKTQISPDGFTLRAPGVPMGHRIHYRYMVDGKTQTGSIVSQGDSETGQTVYTGGRPSSVQILAVTAPGQALPAEKPKPAPSPSRDTTRTDDDSFRGYPSAYR